MMFIQTYNHSLIRLDLIKMIYIDYPIVPCEIFDICIKTEIGVFVITPCHGEENAKEWMTILSEKMKDSIINFEEEYEKAN